MSKSTVSLAISPVSNSKKTEALQASQNIRMEEYFIK
jgi:hypothetical protein